MPRVSRITVYPFKSLDGLAAQRATALASGALEHDRQFAVIDQSGQFVNGKRTAKIHRLRSSIDPVARTIALETDGDRSGAEQRFHLDADRQRLESWLSDFFAMTVGVVENCDGGFPDDIEAPGPTVISTATLQTVASWFNLGLAETRRRFRANIEIDDVEPFWEDRLYGAAGAAVRFTVGGVCFAGTNPCQRCVVPSRSSRTGEPNADFAKSFAQLRDAALPAWADRARFNHFYRLAINTRLADRGTGVIALGDSAKIHNL